APLAADHRRPAAPAPAPEPVSGRAGGQPAPRSCAGSAPWARTRSVSRVPKPAAPAAPRPAPRKPWASVHAAPRRRVGPARARAPRRVVRPRAGAMAQPPVRRGLAAARWAARFAPPEWAVRSAASGRLEQAGPELLSGASGPPERQAAWAPAFEAWPR